MYAWRQLTTQQRQELLKQRMFAKRPWHSPPHRQTEHHYYHLTAACYEHQHIIGKNPDRMSAFGNTLMETLEKHSEEITAWCVLPNHYHALVASDVMLDVIKDVGKMHGRLSWQWNGEDNRRGRKVWFNCVDRALRNEKHLWATVNYIHHNPVHHGYVQHWQAWPFSSAASFLERVGREKAVGIWSEYPILDYGKGWDDANF